MECRAERWCEDVVDFSGEKRGFPLSHLREEALRCGKDPHEPHPKRPTFEVADIFRLYGGQYRGKHRLSVEQSQAMSDMEGCRTSAFGSHWDVCDRCGYVEKAYCSCHNRHCPKCHGVAARIWVKERLRDLLPAPYYHVVFTLPDEDLHPFYLYNARVVYDLLFDSASRTLLTFGRDPRWLGGEMGFTGVLHTWGQTLWLHPHVHFVVPAGGINEEGQWVWAKHEDTFLFPVKALSMRFRKLFTEGLKEAFETGRLNFPPDRRHLESEEEFDRWLRALGQKEFVVFSKAPLRGPEEVVRYVGRYTHRVAISNQRILSIDDGQIRFSYKNYRNGEEQGDYTWEEMSLGAEEFIRRFLYHILPKGFHKIRHYGFLGNGKKGRLEQIRMHLLLEEGKGFDPDDDDEQRMSCPVCKVGKLLPVLVIHRFGTVVIRNASFIRMCEHWDDTS